jgi:hypothetical protein
LLFLLRLRPQGAAYNGLNSFRPGGTALGGAEVDAIMQVIEQDKQNLLRTESEPY